MDLSPKVHQTIIACCKLHLHNLLTRHQRSSLLLLSQPCSHVHASRTHTYMHVGSGAHASRDTHSYIYTCRGWSYFASTGILSPTTRLIFGQQPFAAAATACPRACSSDIRMHRHTLARRGRGYLASFGILSPTTRLISLERRSHRSGPER